MPKSKGRHNNVKHANKVDAWKQRKVYKQRLAVARMYAKLPWWKKLGMKFTVLTTAIKATYNNAGVQLKNMSKMNKIGKSINAQQKAYRPQNRG